MLGDELNHNVLQMIRPNKSKMKGFFNKESIIL